MISMKKVMEIFKRDLCRLRKTPAAIIVAVGMCIIPALYAWFNIAANRDPYGNTANIKVAVANNDVGAENKKRTLDAGRQILDQMESDGPREEVQALRVQLEQLLPTQQEEELSGQIQALFRDQAARNTYRYPLSLVSPGPANRLK